MMDDKKPWEMDWGDPQAKPAGQPATPPAVVYGAPQDPIDRQYKEGQVQGQTRDVTNDALNNDNTRSQITYRNNEYDFNVKKYGTDTANKYRDDFSQNPGVRAYASAFPYYVAGLRTTADAGGDLALVTNFAKLMDPATGVREGEAASVANAQPWVQQMIASANKQLGTGGSFTPQFRAQLRRAMYNQMSALGDGYGVVRSQFEDLAKRHELNPADVVGTDPRATYKDLETKAFSGKAGTLTIGPDGKPTFTMEDISDGSDAADAGGKDTLGAWRDFTSGVKDGSYRINPDYTAEVTGPGGKTVKIGIPDNIVNSDWYHAVYAGRYGSVPKLMVSTGDQTDELTKNYEARLAEFNTGVDKYDTSNDPKLLKEGKQLLYNGATQQFSDEIAGAAGATGELLRTGSSKSAGRVYNLARDAQNYRLAQDRKDTGWAGTGAEITGSLLLPVGRAAEVPASIIEGAGGALSGAARMSMLAGAKTGAKIGALNGAGMSDPGLSNRLGGALKGGALGAVGGGAFGGAAPIVGKYVVSPLAKAVGRVSGRDTDAPLNIIANALSDDAGGIGGAGAKMDDAATRGSPMMLADTGDNARAVLASAARRQGTGKTMARTAVIDRQKAQMERISDAVRRDLGPTANIREQGEAFIEKAKTEAAPLYDEFARQPGASSVKLDDLSTRPSFQKALTKARALAQEEGVDPKAIGFDLDASGNTVIVKVPSWKTLDYVKRGLDDVVEGYRDTTTGKLVLDEQGRAVNNTLRMLMSRMDNGNPLYAEARGAYAGPMKMKDALEKGAKALNRSPDDLAAEVKNLTPSEQGMYRMGLRKAITDFLESKGDMSDKSSALIGTPKRRAALEKAFGGKAEFSRFMDTLGDEQAMNETYRRLNTGSLTAENLATDDSIKTGVPQAIVGAGLSAMRGDGLGAIGRLARGAREAGKFGVGKTGEATRDSIVSYLSETDPLVVRELIRDANRVREAGKLASGKSLQGSKVLGTKVGRTVGSVVGTTKNLGTQ